MTKNGIRNVVATSATTPAPAVVAGALTQVEDQMRRRIQDVLMDLLSKAEREASERAWRAIYLQNHAA
jgi:hypothetical protein